MSALTLDVFFFLFLHFIDVLDRSLFSILLIQSFSSVLKKSKQKVSTPRSRISRKPSHTHPLYLSVYLRACWYPHYCLSQRQKKNLAHFRICYRSQMSIPSTVASSSRMSQNKNILVIYAGGTIGMKRNEMGSLEPKKGYLTEKMKTMLELRESALMARFDILEYNPLLDSSDMNSTDYLKIARDVEKNYEKYDGFLITIGTDTMHYAASALSFLLYNLSKPVIVTGAMVPLAQPFNDARRNLILGMMLAAHPSICEVCIFFNDSLFRGNRCDKVLHTFAAFQSLGYPALGVISGKNFNVRKQLLLRQPSGRIRILSDMKARVFAFRMNPEMDVLTLLQVIGAKRETEGKALKNKEKGSNTQRCQHDGLVNGVVLVVHGIGSVNGSLADHLRRIAEVAQQNDVVVCVTTPDIRKTLSKNAVARLRQISECFVYLHDMCLSTAETKLMYLFGKGLSSQEVAKQMVRNLRGELSPPEPPSCL